MAIVSTQFDKIYKNVLNGIKTKNIDASDLVIIATSAMQIVQKYPELTGEDKKRMVIDILARLVDESDLVPAKYQDASLIFIQYTLPNMIDAVVNAYQHKIKLKKVGQRCGCISATD